jgi:SecD/SecF fusion protein
MATSPWKPVLYGLIIVFGIVVALPNVIPSTQMGHWPSWLPSKRVALGLDLKGGAHLVLELDEAALREEILNTAAADARAALREARVGGISVRVENDAVVFRGEAARIANAASALRSALGLSDARAMRSLLLEQPSASELRLHATDAGVLDRQKSALEQSVEIVRRRIDAIGVAEPTVQKLGANRILVQLPGAQDPSSVRKLLGSTAKLTFHRVGTVSGDGARIPEGYMELSDARGTRYVVERQPLLQGDRLLSANASMDSRTHAPVVSFRFDDLGTKTFATITSENVGKQFAIVLDGKVLSAPVIREPIIGGAGQIEGGFTTAEASALAALLRAGALPVPLTVVQESMVGPDLGSDAIRIGAVTGAIGFALVLVFMTVVYRGWGLVANLALALNVILTFAALTLLNVTLTLPGIAGIVLGMGLAVDANVLINERIREETRAGKSAFTALHNGFDRAYATIIDSNVTTLIATALLFWLGSGPVQGFAVTMAFGIAISMFTAVAVVKAIMSTWVQAKRPKQFLIKSLLPAWVRERTPNFKFMRARFLGLALSFVLSTASVLLFFNPGLNYGVDFTGGVLIEATMPQAPHVAELRSGLEHLDAGEVGVQRIGDASVIVRVELPPNASEATQQQLAERAKEVIQNLDSGTQFDRVDVIGPKISGELTDAGILAVLFASLAMFAYIWIRFEWSFAVGAIVTLALDVTKAIGFFALTGLEFNLTAIAALLTLIGYSVNDKVVVYDRMRDNLKRFPDRPLRDVIDDSINETLARSLYTSITALLALLPMAIWGGATVQSFAVPMVFGIVIAASSSVFIAAPILLFLGERRLRRESAQPDPRLEAIAAEP